MKTASPLDKGRVQGCWEGEPNQTRRSATAVAVVRSVVDEHGTATTPAVAVGPGIPSSTEEGSLFSTSCRLARHAKQRDFRQLLCGSL